MRLPAKSMLNYVIYIWLLFFFLPIHTLAQSLTPNQLPNLALWLRADTGVVLNGNNVSQWQDVSGNNNHCSASGSAQPAYLNSAPLLNCKPAVKFNGSSNVLTGAAISGIDTTSLSVFIVVQGFQQSNTNAKILIGFGPVSSTGIWLYQGSAAGTLFVRNHNSQLPLPTTGFPFTIVEAVKQYNVRWDFFRNGVSAGVPTTASALVGAFTNGNYTIGNGSSAFLNAEIAEIIVYKSALSNADRIAIENYLFAKYTPPVSLGADVVSNYSVCPVALKDGNCKRFSNYVWSNNSAADTLLVTQSGSYSVTVTDVFGRISSDTITVSIPSANLLQQDTTICLGNTIMVSSQLSGFGGYTYEWQNGNTGNVFNASNAGEYYVKVSDGSCFIYSDTLTLTIDSFSAKIDLGADTAVCAGNKIGLKKPSVGWNTFSFLWSTNSADSLLTINTPGQYSVSVTNPLGCTAVDTIAVSILGSAPIANFSNNDVCLGSLFSPVNSSTSTDTAAISSYLWDFGNNNTSTVFQPSFMFTTTGVKLVTLTVITTVGCSDIKSKQVQVNPLPVAQFAVDTSCYVLPALFVDASTVDSPDNITQWYWNFGDGNTSTQTNPLHQYATSGIYAVTHIVTTNKGCSDTITKNSVVVGSSPIPGNFSLLAPIDAATLSQNQIAFIWQQSNSAVRYTLLVSTTPSFTSAVTYVLGNVTSHTVTVTGNQTYYWKVRAYNLCNDSIETTARQFFVFSPADIPNLTVWLRSDAGITFSSPPTNPPTVQQWNDISGNNNNASQATLASRPSFVSSTALINNYPTVQFSGTSNFLAGPLLAGLDTSSISIFAVLKANNGPTGGKVVFAAGTSSTGAAHYFGNNTMVFQNAGSNVATTATFPNSGFPFGIAGMAKEFGVSAKLYWNGIERASSNNAAVCGAFTNTAYQVGKGAGFTASQNLNADVAEIIVYKKALTNAERQLVENYIYNRYAPPVNLGPDINQTYSLCPVILDAQNRFVSYLWSTGETTSSIEARKSGSYWVQTIDVFGRVSSDTINVTIPYLGMNVTDTLLCIGSSANIAPVLAASPYTYLWNYAQTTQSISVSTAGNYVCSITDNNNCTYISDTVHVAIDAFALVNLLPADTAICIDNVLPLNLAGNVPQAIAWSDNSTDDNLIVYGAGNYSVTVTNTNGCSATDAVNITTKGTAPLVNFSAPSVCFGAVTNFTDETLLSGSDNIKTWYWDFGGTGTSALQNPTKIFPSPGSYDVTLSVVTDSGCTGLKTKQVTSAVPPEPSFTFPSIVCGGTPVTLTDKSVFIFGDTITGWIWTFNGVDTITTQNAVYEFPSQGVFDVALTAVSKSGCKNTTIQQVDVFPPLTADFTVSNTCVGDSTWLKDATPTFSVVSWLWNFGDFSPFSNKQNPKHKYNTAGTYTVTLTVENAIGCKDDVTKQVSIVNKPTANFGNLITCEDRFYTPLDSSTANNDTISAWRWTISGNNYNGKTPSHLFADTGSYSVKLRVTTQKECVDSVIKTVSVKPAPKALFSYTPLYGDAPVDVSFINQSLHGATYFWNFGDGDVSTFYSPTHTYATNDTFLISLIAQSAFGCVDSTQRIFIAAPTELDIAVTSVTATKQLQPDGSYLIGVEANVSNMATRLITDALFYITIGSGGAISEEWSGLLNTGETQPIAFTAKFVAAPENANSYICVNAVSVNNGEAEIRTDNNLQCTTVSQGIQLVGPSPNPMSNQATLGIILPKAGQVTIDIVNAAGQYIVKGEQVASPKGRSDYSLPADKMRTGKYYIRVYHNDEVIVRKFIVAK
ncbi:MAG: PKD domain-containing protein [Chitinophagales bacterium]|nr:PKD domain-containing protein [Chitinophagales bacterium]